MPAILSILLVVDMTNTIDDERKNPWKAALIDELVCIGIFSKKHLDNPRLALKDAINWNTSVALDPLVSSDAKALQVAALERVRKAIEDHPDWGRNKVLELISLIILYSNDEDGVIASDCNVTPHL